MFGLETQLQNLPDLPGIYLFYNSQKELIYVGKATSLRSRVRSYFRGARTSRPIEQMIHEVVNIKTIVTDSVLEAIILEGKYIKKNQPKYNVDWKDDKSWNYLAFTKDEFPKLIAIREHEIKKIKNLNTQQFGDLFGPFPGLKTAEVLKILRRIFKYSTCTPNKKHKPCFYKQINECLGVCTSEITTKDYKQKVVRPLTLFLSGKKQALLRQLNLKMKSVSRVRNFEEAARLRDQIFSLQKIQDVALLNKDFFRFEIGPKNSALAPVKIEGYDISNLGKSDKVGSLVVFKDDVPVKSEYRKFNIKTVSGQSDVDCLAEVINRRLNHSDWPLPDYFLIDGGAPQVNTVANILRARQVNRSVIGIAKGPKRDRNDFIFDHSNKNVVEFIRNNQMILIAVRDEAHRFAISFNRSKRIIK